MRCKINLIVLVLLCCTYNYTFADPGNDGSTAAVSDTVKKSLLQKVPEWMAEYNVPCVGVGLLENGRIKWIKVFGNLKKGVPAPANTLFNIASQTKPVAALVALRLAARGSWDLDEPLAHYWIDPDIAHDPYLMKVTTRLVLSHQTGFPNWRSDSDSGRLYFKFVPGTKFGYSGEGYEYLRRALEKKFDRPLDKLMDSVVLRPLRMRDTRYWGMDLDTNRFAMWHDGKGNRYPNPIKTPVSAADDLITTIKDYSKLGVAVINGAGLSDTVYADMIRAQVKIKEDYYRGLGWGLVKGLPDGEYALEHGGSDIGVRTMAIFLPKSKKGIVVMTNADNGMFVIDRVIKLALPHGAAILEIMNKGAATHMRIPVPDSTIERYTGIYKQTNGKMMKVIKVGNAIQVSGDGLPTAVLFPESKNRFFLEGYDVQLEFTDSGAVIVYEGGKQVMKINKDTGAL